MNQTSLSTPEPKPVARQLADSLLEQVALAMGLSYTKLVHNLLKPFFDRAARYMAETCLELDRIAHEDSPISAAGWLLRHFVAGDDADGTDNIPQNGPLIIAANHPASYDSLAILSHLNRTDFKVVIADVPPFHYIPTVCEHAIFAPRTDTHGRMLVLREAVRHLKDNGSLLIFPRGGIEPDPAFMTNPDAEFNLWSRSLEFFMRRVPQAQVLVTIVSGVISPDAMHHPITRLRRALPDRQRLAFMYQFVRQMLAGNELFGLRSLVSFGEVVRNHGQNDLLDQIEQAAHRTLDNHLEMIKPSPAF
jgi:1-acyl-sn-glycerol-3-phosphate acyltransferase